MFVNMQNFAYCKKPLAFWEIMPLFRGEQENAMKVFA
jgi:hypothetical protein